LFRIGAQCGLKPQEVLDMSLDMLKAVIQGYSDHIFDLQLVAVHQGYWSGYYNRAKKPKNLESVLKKMLNVREKNSKKSNPHVRRKAEDVDVEAFLAMEQKRLSKM
jgi:hypothetical protein